MTTEPAVTSAEALELASSAGTSRCNGVSGSDAPSAPTAALALDLVQETCARFMRRRRTDRSGVSRFYRSAFVREMNARHLCLCLSLRALGFLVETPVARNGPLWALADGLQMLAPLGARFYHVALADAPMTLRAGPYVLWLLGHFMPMRVLQHSVVDFPSGSLLFRIVTGTAAELVDGVIELSAVASDGRRRLRERLGREAGLILYLDLCDFPIAAWLRTAFFERLLRAEASIVARDRALRSLLRDVLGGSRG